MAGGCWPPLRSRQRVCAPCRLANVGRLDRWNLVFESPVAPGVPSGHERHGGSSRAGWAGPRQEGEESTVELNGGSTHREKESRSKELMQVWHEHFPAV
jgi:hypothetical protein